MSPVRRNNKNKGGGIINTLINKLPLELHLPGYQYCGPGTKLRKRLDRGDKGINPLDSACKEHDIAYDHSKSLTDRQKADYILENRAWNRFKSKDSNLKEKAAAWLVTTGMKAKRKIGAGCGFKATIKAAKNKSRVPRVIPIPKTGGMLPLIPIFAGLSALGALTGGIANVVKTVSEFNRNEPSHLGRALYLAPNKGGTYKIEKEKGLYLAPHGGGSYKRKGTRKSLKKTPNLQKN
ncbi:uncharacterized protein LOC126553220 [Aphis gossypii]|uniref:uncharacterized protein LOC126553220 n=1 Tax=Aphis gossypii TaxID=80765 RepID=UPI0021593A06|nr:uncharacterized protein LOC126553220 [Aphis gossypii]